MPNTSKAFMLILCFQALASLPGCETERRYPAAPLNDRVALEKLATAYNKVSETIPLSPIKLKPEARRKFVEQVFSEAGYAYSTTLIQLSQVKPSAITQLHKDLKELLFMPHHAVNFDETKAIYSEQELKAIEVIRKNFPD